MRREEIKRMAETTSDPTFVADGEGLIMAWNRAAECLFQLPAAEAIGRPCSEVIRGTDECGSVCSKECIVQQALEHHHPIRNFDLQVETVNGRQWCNASVIVAENGSSIDRFTVHIMRPIDLRKRLEILVRDFVVSNTNVPAEEAAALISSTRAPGREAELTSRELEILRLLSKGNSTHQVADTLHISSATVNNHVQH
jgi:PAS domain S-box-containing protein